MHRRNYLRKTGGLVALGLAGVTPVAAESETANGLMREAEPIDLDQGDVVAQTSDPTASNFEETFTFWRVDHGVAYSEADYRETVRLGPTVYDLGGYSGGSFWLGVTAPDTNGIQHPIPHKGRVDLYLKDVDTGSWRLLSAQFDGQRNLVNVNGVTPE